MGFREDLLGNWVNRGNPHPTSKRKLLRFVRQHELVITLCHVNTFYGIC
jgi:hypothetical protein